MIEFLIPIFLHFPTQKVFPSYLGKFQSITNIRTYVFWTFISDSLRPPLIFLVPSLDWKLEKMTSYSQLYNNKINACILIGQSARISSNQLKSISSNQLNSNQSTRRIRKSLCGSWFTNSSRVLPTSRVVYQPINHRNLWSIA